MMKRQHFIHIIAYAGDAHQWLVEYGLQGHRSSLFEVIEQ